MSTEPNFTQWMDGLSSVEEDHVFTPIGQQSDAVTELLIRRAALVPDEGIDLAELGLEDEEEERALTETKKAPAKTYTEQRDEIDAQIAEQLEKDHPDAPRIRLRGLSDEDFEEVMTELAKIKVEGKPLNDQQVIVEANLRYVSRAAVTPKMTPEDVRLLRRSINRGEWARLLDHMNRLAYKSADEVTHPN